MWDDSGTVVVLVAETLVEASFGTCRHFRDKSLLQIARTEISRDLGRNPANPRNEVGHSIRTISKDLSEFDL